MRKGIALTAAVFALACPAGASALTPDQTMRTYEPQGAQAWLPLAHAVARAYWADRGLTECEGDRVFMVWYEVGGLGGHIAAATTGDCADDDSAVIRASVALNERGWMEQCAAIIHEYGHLNGLDHAPRPRIMDNPIPPRACVPPERARARADKAAEHARNFRRHGWTARRNRAHRRAQCYRAHARRIERLAAVHGAPWL